MADGWDINVLAIWSGAPCRCLYPATVEAQVKFPPRRHAHAQSSIHTLGKRPELRNKNPTREKDIFNSYYMHVREVKKTCALTGRTSASRRLEAATRREAPEDEAGLRPRIMPALQRQWAEERRSS